MQDIYFHLPGIFEHFELYELFLFFYKEENEKFNSWAKIGSIYGAPYGAIWNGGRVKDRPPVSEGLVIETIRYYDISCRFTFTNPFITEKHLGDGLCNIILEKFNWEGHKNQIIVNSPVLEEYLRKTYPTYQFISSTTKCITNSQEALEEINKNYIMTVIDYNFNKDMDFLKSIPNKEKVELLINPVCHPKCPRRREHYERIGLSALHTDGLEPFVCDAEGRLFHEAMKNLLFISLDDIKNIYAPLGFKNFKIEGRTTPTEDMIEILTYYMVKPEYQLEMRQKLRFASLE